MPEKKTLYASLDIGTSQLKLAVYCPSLSDSMNLINSYPNEVIYGNSGVASGDYHSVSNKSFALFKELGAFIQTNKIEVLYLGICGHISSLIEWNKTNDEAAEKLFPTWLDTTCYGSLEKYNAIMGNGKSRDIIGTFLPAGTNWLLTKLLHKKKTGFKNNAIFLQVSDVIFHQLTGLYQT
ncbi:MAG TPA: hypothetical protein VM935_15080, partial [Chitinophagaceae bacterium]|nr:hypothetical protein [Chitinophagaceae bacterium]